MYIYIKTVYMYIKISRKGEINERSFINPDPGLLPTGQGKYLKNIIVLSPMPRCPK